MAGYLSRLDALSFYIIIGSFFFLTAIPALLMSRVRHECGRRGRLIIFNDDG